MLIFDKDTSKDVLRNFLCFYENILNFVTTKKKLLKLFLSIVKFMSSKLPKKAKKKADLRVIFASYVRKLPTTSVKNNHLKKHHA